MQNLNVFLFYHLLQHGIDLSQDSYSRPFLRGLVKYLFRNVLFFSQIFQFERFFNEFRKYVVFLRTSFRFKYNLLL